MNCWNLSMFLLFYAVSDDLKTTSHVDLCENTLHVETHIASRSGPPTFGLFSKFAALGRSFGRLFKPDISNEMLSWPNVAHLNHTCQLKQPKFIISGYAWWHIGDQQWCISIDLKAKPTHPPHTHTFWVFPVCFFRSPRQHRCYISPPLNFFQCSVYM